MIMSMQDHNGTPVQVMMIMAPSNNSQQSSIIQNQARQSSEAQQIKGVSGVHQNLLQFQPPAQVQYSDSQLGMSQLAYGQQGVMQQGVLGSQNLTAMQNQSQLSQTFENGSLGNESLSLAQLAAQQAYPMQQQQVIMIPAQQMQQIPANAHGQNNNTVQISLAPSQQSAMTGHNSVTPSQPAYNSNPTPAQTAFQQPVSVKAEPGLAEPMNGRSLQLQEIIKQLQTQQQAQQLLHAAPTVPTQSAVEVANSGHPSGLVDVMPAQVATAAEYQSELAKEAHRILVNLSSGQVGGLQKATPEVTPKPKQSSSDVKAASRGHPLYPKCRQGLKGPALKLEELQPLFQLPIGEAAKALGVGETFLKKASRKLGIEKWPYKRVYRRHPYGDGDAVLSDS
mmetsp:Transcript_3169/g.5103  ORF Transcript_3169/g.5103 Transcript_3169/m.5103 type:complete len:394 (+) Transcript_3169:40-1221(+)